MSAHIRGTEAELVNTFGFHPATPVTIPLHEEVRARALDFATWLSTSLPESREKSLALTALQEAAMWSNAAIAINLAPVQAPTQSPR